MVACLWYEYFFLRIGVQGCFAKAGRVRLKAQKARCGRVRPEILIGGMWTGRYYLACCPMGNLRFLVFGTHTYLTLTSLRISCSQGLPDRAMAKSYSRRGVVSKMCDEASLNQMSLR